MAYALVYQGVVRQVEEEPFPMHPDFQWVEIPADTEVKVGALYIDGVFSNPGLAAPPVIPDTVFQNATKIMVKSLMAFINGTISKTELNNRFEAVKDYLAEVER